MCACAITHGWPSYWQSIDILSNNVRSTPVPVIYYYPRQEAKNYWLSAQLLYCSDSRVKAASVPPSDLCRYNLVRNDILQLKSLGAYLPGLADLSTHVEPTRGRNRKIRGGRGTRIFAALSRHLLPLETPFFNVYLRPWVPPKTFEGLVRGKAPKVMTEQAWGESRTSIRYNVMNRAIASVDKYRYVFTFIYCMYITQYCMLWLSFSSRKQQLHVQQ